MSTEKQTHYRKEGKMIPFDYFTIRPDSQLGFIVHGFGSYSGNSVLAGQSMKKFLDSFDTRAAAERIYPEAKNGSGFTDPQNSFNHLPGENDPVPGGMYPDDISDQVANKIAYDEGADVFETIEDDEK